jgi:hypothetical protein
MLEWWGYIHKSGTKHVKRYFGPEDIEEAKESPFVAVACGPWACSGREEALKHLEEESK